MFADRLAAFEAHLSANESLAEATRDIALSLLGLFKEVEDYNVELGEPEYFSMPLSTLGESALDQLRRSVSSDSGADVLNCVRNSADRIVALLNGMGAELSAFERDRADMMTSRARALSGQAAILQDQATLRSAAVKLNAELQESATKAKDAAGIVGTSSLATYFGRYANRENRLANWFRFFALAGFVAALAFALIFGNGANSVFVTFEDEWTALAFKVAGALGIGGIAAYLARQSGQHRRMANWARSTEVQLQSFPALIEPLGYDQQADMYSLLARRVLAAPPERASGSADDSVGAVQLIDVLTSVLKRSSPPGN
ncbi:hypothetical protein AB0O14_18635 [Microbacterium foliorum]